MDPLETIFSPPDGKIYSQSNGLKIFRRSREGRLQRENLNPLGAFILVSSGKSIS
jgi:hypothetical protein